MFGVIILISLDIILIPIYGLVGAAFALLASHLTILIIDMICLRSLITVIAKDFVIQLFKVLLASIIMFFMVQILIAYTTWYVLIILGAGVYFVVLMMVGGLDVVFLKRILNFN